MKKGRLLSLDGPSRPHRTVDSLFTLQGPLDSAGRRSSISAVCFLPTNQLLQQNNNDQRHDLSGSSDESSEEEELNFRCRRTTLIEKKDDHDAIAQARSSAASLSLSGTFLASSHANGDAFLWDLGRRRIVSEFCSSRQRGPGLALRRMGQQLNEPSQTSSPHVLYHTRDDHGTVSIHNIELSTTDHNHSISSQPSCPVVVEFQTDSRTFCAAVPCAGIAHLVAMPSLDESCVTVRDIRVAPTCSPVVVCHGAGIARYNDNTKQRQHRMLTSLAMSSCGTTSTAEEHQPPRPVVACGMDSGSVFFHDLAMPERSLAVMKEERSSSVTDDSSDLSAQTPPVGSVKLGKDPILALDLAPSSLSTTSEAAGSVVAIAGMAGDATDLCQLPESERGTVAVLKAVFPPLGGGDSVPTARLRARIPTCQVGVDNGGGGGGKPGVATCRFRPDGRIFAIGGWDKRLRVFDRTGNALAILKAHTDSVTAVDWAPDAAISGMLATGAGDGRIFLWRCFPNT